MIPNGSHLKEYLPKGVMKVVNFLLSGCRGICQNLEAASSDINIVAPLSFAVIPSAVGRMYLFLFTASFSVFVSTQMRTLPFFLGAGTISAQPVCRLGNFLNDSVLLHML